MCPVPVSESKCCYSLLPEVTDSVLAYRHSVPVVYPVPKRNQTFGCVIQAKSRDEVPKVNKSGSGTNYTERSKVSPTYLTFYVHTPKIRLMIISCTMTYLKHTSTTIGYTVLASAILKCKHKVWPYRNWKMAHQMGNSALRHSTIIRDVTQYYATVTYIGPKPIPG